MDKDIVIRAENVCKQYGLRPALREKWYSLAGWGYRNNKGHWALRDINIKLRRGETLGIIGLNGAGKSTLLKILAGITPLTRGKIEIQGRTFAMIELNAGIHQELTGRENVYLLGAITGIPKFQMQNLLPVIEEFSELGEFFDLPVRKYSSGMLARLGFSVAINIKADILLIDEVFSVGDLVFQQKCFRKMEEIISSGTTILLVTHAMRNLERICERAILIEQGQIIEQGPVREVMAAYFKLSADRAAEELLKRSNTTPIIHSGSGQLRVIGAEILDKQARVSDFIGYHEQFTVRLQIEVKQPVESPHLMIIISTADMINVAAVTTGRTRIINLPDFTPGKWVIDCQLEPNNLLPGVYLVNAAFDSKKGPKIETVRNIKKFQVIVSGSLQQENNLPGFFWLDCKWSWQKQSE